MATQQTQNRNNDRASANGSAGRTYDFKPVEFDGNALPPMVVDGGYTFTVAAAKVSKTSSDAMPMLVIEWKAEETLEGYDTDEHRASIGATVTEFLTFFPEGDSRGKMGKLRYRAICEKIGANYDIVPKALKSKADFEAFQDALKDARIDGWVISKADKKDPTQTRQNLLFEKPGGGSTELAPLDDGGNDEEERPAARSGGKSSKGGASARGGRR